MRICDCREHGATRTPERGSILNKIKDDFPEEVATAVICEW